MGMLKKISVGSDDKPAAPSSSSKSPHKTAPAMSLHSRRPFLNLKPPQSPRSKPLPSMFGRQILSQRTTGPALLFGTSDRATADNQYFSQELAKCRAGLDGPGPVYEVKSSSMGKQIVSRNESAPEVAFGASSRFVPQRYGKGNPGPGAYSSPSGFGPQVLSYQKSPWVADFSRSTRDQQYKIYMSGEFDKINYGTTSPGPTICDETSSLGPQAAAPFKSAPKVCFGTEKRFKHALVATNPSPGVGRYDIISSIGKQHESKKKNYPAFSFSQCNREQRAKVYISADHDKAHYGEESPGPGSTLKAFPSLGDLQVDSRKASCNVPRFGRATRFKEYYTDNPGPGNYNC